MCASDCNQVCTFMCDFYSNGDACKSDCSLTLPANEQVPVPQAVEEIVSEPVIEEIVSEPILEEVVANKLDSLFNEELEIVKMKVSILQTY